jgi:hypothetical protein|tara:strand:- start:5 stop:154 length:150 start_codon:yes stop_codon:yes gene_type:complete
MELPKLAGHEEANASLVAMIERMKPARILPDLLGRQGLLLRLRLSAHDD